LKNVWPFERKNLMSFSLNKLSQNKIEAYIGILVRMDMQSKNILDGNIWDSIHDLSVSISKNKLPNPMPLELSSFFTFSLNSK